MPSTINKYPAPVPEYTALDLPPLGWSVIRVARPGDMYARHKLGYWREIRTGLEVSEVGLLTRINETGWENREGGEQTWRNHIGFEILETRAAFTIDVDHQQERYPEVASFVASMYRELAANSHKGDQAGWRSMGLRDAWQEMAWHLGKLTTALKDDDERKMREYLADIANGAMMFADLLDQRASRDQAARDALLVEDGDVYCPDCNLTYPAGSAHAQLERLQPPPGPISLEGVVERARSIIDGPRPNGQ